MDDREKLEIKREERRRRRVRSQITAYAVLAVMILIIAAGIALGIDYLTKRQKETEQKTQESQNMIEDLLGEEEEISTPEPTPPPRKSVLQLFSHPHRAALYKRRFTGAKELYSCSDPDK